MGGLGLPELQGEQPHSRQDPVVGRRQQERVQVQARLMTEEKDGRHAEQGQV
jgi:hypothetical protein